MLHATCYMSCWPIKGTHGNDSVIMKLAIQYQRGSGSSKSTIVTAAMIVMIAMATPQAPSHGEAGAGQRVVLQHRLRSRASDSRVYTVPEHVAHGPFLFKRLNQRSFEARIACLLQGTSRGGKDAQI